MAGLGSPHAFGYKSQTAMPLYNCVFAQGSSPISLKRRASDNDEVSEYLLAKRQRVATPPDTPPAPAHQQFSPPSSPSAEDGAHANVDRIVDIANEHLGREILVRHQELRFINQELAKCQVALEQLRRCHLIPYPTACPTPQQIVDIIDGHVPALPSSDGQTPQWAPPYGVTDGPYARHYAKWCIPDPKFDGLVPEWSPETLKNAEGRSTRHSLSALDGATIGRRAGRGQSIYKQPTATPAAPKLKGTQYMKRESDGATVKLVCIGCQREDFCSVQGFINHVRISHNINYVSHEEAAKACGHVVNPSKNPAPAEENKVTSTSALGAQESQVPAGTVHPLAAAGRQAMSQLDRKLSSSLDVFPQGRTPSVTRTSNAMPKLPFAADAGRRSSKSFVGSDAAPALSMLLQNHGFEGDFETELEDAKIKMILDDDLSSEDEDADGERDENDESELLVATKPVPSNGARVPVASSCGRAPTTEILLEQTASSPSSVSSPTADEDASSVYGPNLMDIEHSSKTATSKTPPSLVADDTDGGDDSDDGAFSDAGESPAGEERIAEVNLEYPEEHLAQHAAGASSSAKKDEDRHVTFVSPVPGKPSTGSGRKSNV